MLYFVLASLLLTIQMQALAGWGKIELFFLLSINSCCFCLKEFLLPLGT